MYAHTATCIVSLLVGDVSVSQQTMAMPAKKQKEICFSFFCVCFFFLNTKNFHTLMTPSKDTMMQLLIWHSISHCKDWNGVNLWHTSALRGCTPTTLSPTCLPLQLYHICSGKSSKSIGRSGNTVSLSKVLGSLIHETTITNKHSLSDFSQEQLRLLCRNIPKPLLDALGMR